MEQTANAVVTLTGLAIPPADPMAAQDRVSAGGAAMAGAAPVHSSANAQTAAAAQRLIEVREALRSPMFMHPALPFMVVDGSPELRRDFTMSPGHEHSAWAQKDVLLPALAAILFAAGMHGSAVRAHTHQ